jgi:hypothetical protein
LPAEVDIAPAQPGRLAAAQAPQRDQVIGGMQPVTGDAVQELRGLGSGPHRHGGTFPGALPVLDPARRPHHRPGPAGARQLGPAGRVLADEPAADGGIQRRAQRGADPVQRGG